MAAGGGGWGGIMADVPVFEVPDEPGAAAGNAAGGGAGDGWGADAGGAAAWSLRYAPAAGGAPRGRRAPSACGRGRRQLGTANTHALDTTPPPGRAGAWTRL